MIRYESSVAVARPPEDVFRYLVEPQKQALWSDVPMRRLDDGPPGAGSRIELVLAGGPLKVTIGMEYTAIEPPRRVAFRTFSGPIHWDGEYRVDPEGTGGARLSQQGTLVFTGLWRLLEPIVGAEVRRAEIKELERLKQAAEAA